MTHSLKTRASFFIALFIIIGSALSSYLFISAERDSIERELIIRGTVLSLSLQKAAEEGLAKENLDFVKKASYIVQTEGVEIAQVFTTLWQTMDTYPDEAFDERPVPAAITHFTESDELFIKKDKNRYDFYSAVNIKPFADSPTIGIGYTRLALSTATMRSVIDKAITNHIIVAIILSILAMFAINALVERLVIRPVVNLLNSVRMVKNGELPYMPPERSKSEIGELSMEFYAMTLAVKDREELLQQERDKVRDQNQKLLEAQEELVRKEKLSILGQLSGSVGHELRNPLGVMSNAVYYLKMVLSDADETIKEYLGIIKQEIDNSQRIITDLLDFARTKTPQIKVVTAHELIKESLGRCAVPENIVVRTDLPDALPALMVDAFQMGQVLQNLITNAVQAMPGGGSITICAKGARMDEGQGARDEVSSVVSANEQSGLSSYVVISVSDTGVGISPDGMKRLFQPLFTTKAKGLGLGLTVCKNLIEANNGEIEVESRTGEGTTFSVALPVEGRAG